MTFNIKPCKAGNGCSTGESCSDGKCVADPTVVVKTLAGGKKGTTDGSAALSKFHGPYGIAVGLNDELYVADYYNNRIRRVSADRKTVSTWAGTSQGYLDAHGTAARFWKPTGIEVAPDGTLYVVDNANKRIRHIDKKRLVSTVSGGGPGTNGVNPDGPGSTAVGSSSPIRRTTRSGGSGARTATRERSPAVGAATARPTAWAARRASTTPPASTPTGMATCMSSTAATTGSGACVPTAWSTR